MPGPNGFLRPGAPCRIWTRAMRLHRADPLPGTVVRKLDAGHWEVERCGLTAAYAENELIQPVGE